MSIRCSYPSQMLSARGSAVRAEEAATSMCDCWKRRSSNSTKLLPRILTSMLDVILRTRGFKDGIEGESMSGTVSKLLISTPHPNPCFFR